MAGHDFALWHRVVHGRKRWGLSLIVYLAADYDGVSELWLNSSEGCATYKWNLNRLNGPEHSWPFKTESDHRLAQLL